MVMEKNYKVWELLKVYIFFLLLIVSGSANAQSPCKGDDLCVVQFNAGFNKANEVTWLNKLTDNGEEEIERFQANIMMQMEAKKSDVQGKIDEIIMEGF